MVNIKDAVSRVAEAYNISEDSLEGGTFEPEEMEVLMGLFEKAIGSDDYRDYCEYLTQKAKYLTKGRPNRITPESNVNMATGEIINPDLVICD